MQWVVVCILKTGVMGLQLCQENNLACKVKAISLHIVLLAMSAEFPNDFGAFTAIACISVIVNVVHNTFSLHTQKNPLKMLINRRV